MLNSKKVNEIILILEKLFEAEKKKTSKSKNILDILIATKLSQHTTDLSSYKAFQNLKKDFSDWEAVASAPVSKIIHSIKVCGLAPTKAKDIKNMLLQMQEKYKTLNLNFLKKMTDDDIYSELLAYKGIGKKTISCVLAFAMNRNVFPVDTHVHRILNRLGLVKTKSPDETFESAKKIIPENKKISFHTNLIKFGRSVCKSFNPLCSLCPLFHLCNFNKKYYYKEREVLPPAPLRRGNVVGNKRAKDSPLGGGLRGRTKSTKDSPSGGGLRGRTKSAKDSPLGGGLRGRKKQNDLKRKIEKIKQNNFIILENI